MKGFLKNPRNGLLSLIVLVPALIFAIFFSNYYSIYKDLKNPPVYDSDMDVVVKNPFDGIEAIEENEEYMQKEGVQENENPTDEIHNSPDKTTDAVEIDSPDKTNKIGEIGKTGKPSYNYIVGIYKSRFEKFQQRQENEVYSLMEKARTEYTKNGSKKSSLLGMAPKYLSLVNSLERQANKEIDMLINDLKSELINNSYETDITKEIRDYYNYYKKNLRAQIIKEGTEYL